jgi:hypothetical protein
MHYSDVPTKDFMFFSCGTNGGPPSKPLKNKFDDYHLCKKDINDLKEVYFEYDDEAYYLALAYTDTHSAGFQGTRVFSHSVVLSLLFNNLGIIKGIRIVTDDRVSHAERRGAAGLFLKFENIFGNQPWDCTDLKPKAGEESVRGIFTKKTCIKETLDKKIFLRGDHYRKKGQKTFDPLTKKATTGYFKSTTRLEVYSVDVEIDLKKLIGDI